MRYLVVLLVLFSNICYAKNLYDISLVSSDSSELNLSKYRGKVVLLVNIATRCGHTPQLEGLEQLHQNYKDKGLVVIGIPSNDFGSQTPEGIQEVAKFCKLRYGVSFPLTQKLVIRGVAKAEIASYLVNVSDKKEVSWNFEKFLFDKNGNFVARFKSNVRPLKTELEKKIQETIGR